MVRVKIEPGCREPELASATRRREAVHQAPEAAFTRSSFLDLPQAVVAALAFCPVDRPTGNGHPLAPPGISTLLPPVVTEVFFFALVTTVCPTKHGGLSVSLVCAPIHGLVIRHIT